MSREEWSGERILSLRQEHSALFALLPAESIEASNGLEILELCNKAGTHLYDMLLLWGRSGSVFAAGTADKVAGIIQDDIKCRKLKLKEALKLVKATRERHPSFTGPA